MSPDLGVPLPYLRGTIAAGQKKLPGRVISLASRQKTALLEGLRWLFPLRAESTRDRPSHRA